MKAEMYDLKGNKKGSVELPKIFETKIRADLVSKYFEADKFIQPYMHSPEGGRKHSASGTISHKRHDWKGHYGRGISRVPRKTMWRRGTQFYWIGAEASGTRGGRRVHGPKGIGKERKINKKEIKLAMNSAFAASIDQKYILERYGSLDKLDTKLPIVIQSDFNGAKTKEVLLFLENILGNAWNLALRKKKVRAGKGKLRGRKYKSNAGVLLVIGEKDNLKMKGIDVKKVEDISIKDLYPLGRLTIYTENALHELTGDEK